MDPDIILPLASAPAKDAAVTPPQQMKKRTRNNEATEAAGKKTAKKTKERKVKKEDKKEKKDLEEKKEDEDEDEESKEKKQKKQKKESKKRKPKKKKVLTQMEMEFKALKQRWRNVDPKLPPKVKVKATGNQRILRGGCVAHEVVELKNEKTKYDVILVTRPMAAAGEPESLKRFRWRWDRFRYVWFFGEKLTRSASGWGIFPMAPQPCASRPLPKSKKKKKTGSTKAEAKVEAVEKKKLAPKLKMYQEGHYYPGVDGQNDGTVIVLSIEDDGERIRVGAPRNNLYQNGVPSQNEFVWIETGDKKGEWRPRWDPYSPERIVFEQQPSASASASSSSTSAAKPASAACKFMDSLLA